MHDQAASLIAAIAAARDLLRRHGDTATAPRLDRLIQNLERGDEGAVRWALSEATGSMGSLNDRYLCAANGDDIHDEERAVVNARLRELVRRVEEEARAAGGALA